MVWEPSWTHPPKDRTKLYLSCHETQIFGFLTRARGRVALGMAHTFGRLFLAMSGFSHLDSQISVLLKKQLFCLWTFVTPSIVLLQKNGRCGGSGTGQAPNCPLAPFLAAVCELSELQCPPGTGGLDGYSSWCCAGRRLGGGGGGPQNRESQR